MSISALMVGATMVVVATVINFTMKDRQKLAVIVLIMQRYDVYIS